MLRAADCELVANAPAFLQGKVGGMCCISRETFMVAARSILAGMAVALAGAASAGERCSAFDGSTLQCGRERVRVEGLHAPTLNEPGGAEARTRLDRRIRQGELVIERQGRDKYGRTLGRIYVNGKRITQLDLEPKARQASRRS
jgi:endonuclease YncB( thermonuclease family)